jgi:hypothetical protein
MHEGMMEKSKWVQVGSIELVVMGLLAALVVVLAIPLVSNIGTKPTGMMKPAIAYPGAPAGETR